ncbi:response regulator [Caballeronia arationis]|uniref:response regulator n=1 Tax=Caballeronia arationis TaxID=1777142 RepID=UPI000788C7AB|nr:response regulator [Caballeronia arationis]
MVDDYAIGAEAVALALSYAGHETSFASNGAYAMKRVATWAPDVAVLDINMPPPDGFELAALVRGHDNGSNALIIAHTSMDESAVSPRGLPAGLTPFAKKAAVSIRCKISFGEWRQTSETFLQFEHLLKALP